MKHNNLQRAVEIDKRLKEIAALKTELTKNVVLQLQLFTKSMDHTDVHFECYIDEDMRINKEIDALVKEFRIKLLKAIDAEAAELKKELTGL